MKKTLLTLFYRAKVIFGQHLFSMIRHRKKRFFWEDFEAEKNLDTSLEKMHIYFQVFVARIQKQAHKLLYNDPL
jgi:hypothetical protein